MCFCVTCCFVAFYLVKVLHLVSVGEPGLLVVARLDDKHLVVGEHLREAVGKDLAHLDVELVHLQLLLVALVARLPEAAGVLPYLQLVGGAKHERERSEKSVRASHMRGRQSGALRSNKVRDVVSIRDIDKVKHGLRFFFWDAKLADEKKSKRGT